MAKNESNKPDDVKTVLENEAQAEEQTAPIEAAEVSDNIPALEMIAKEAETLAHEGEVTAARNGGFFVPENKTKKWR